jgi:hypothetical protein
MVFKNEAQLKSFLLQKSQIALAKTQEQIYQILHRFVKEFYNDYSPEMYERTYQLFQSLVKSRIIPTAKGYEAEVYFDIGSLYYTTGNMPSGEEVMKAASNGLHGAIGDDFLYRFGNTGVGIWNDPMKIIDAQAIDMLKNMLISEGIPIKY